jgi:hypothetical protein
MGEENKTLSETPPPSKASQPDIATILAYLKERLLAGGLNEDSAGLEKKILLWQAATEAGKNELEIALRNKKEKTPWVSVLTALVAVATLIGTTYQFVTSHRQNEKVAEDTEWRAAITAVFDNSEGPQTAGGAYLLKSFLSPKSSYQGQARAAATDILGFGGSSAQFKILFPGIIETTTAENAGDLVELCRALESLRYKIEQTNYNSSFVPSHAGLPAHRMSAQEWEDVKNSIRDEVKTAGIGLVQILQKINYRGTDLDLNGLTFIEADLSKSPILKMNLAGVELDTCMVDGAEIESTSTNSYWEYTSWWRAAKIKKELLDYLIQTYPWDKSYAENNYYSGKPTTEDEYNQAVKRLQKLAP